jgi:hypothetical protein
VLFAALAGGVVAGKTNDMTLLGAQIFLGADRRAGLLIGLPGCAPASGPCRWSAWR